MSIENCPLSQIPTEIVAGGPSLVIQVNCSLYIDEDSGVLRYSEVRGQPMIILL